MAFETYRRMEQNISQWNGFAIHGDVKELDRIVESKGSINLDKDDIIATCQLNLPLFIDIVHYLIFLLFVDDF